MSRVLNDSIYVKRSGIGEPALFLHGVPDSADIWDGISAKLNTHFECFAPDLPGFYRSDIPPSFSFQFIAYAEFIESLVQALNIKQPLTLVAHDWGGIFALLWAIQYPHRVKRIVACNFPFGSAYKWHTWAKIWRMPLLGELAMKCMNASLFTQELQRGSRHLSKQEIASSYQKVMTNPSTRSAILSLYRSANKDAFQAFDDKFTLLAEKVPIDILWGKQDPYVSSTIGKNMPSRSFRLVDDCGHWLPLERPDEIIHCLINQSSFP